jgi:hypothetical protein
MTISSARVLQRVRPLGPVMALDRARRGAAGELLGDQGQSQRFEESHWA